MNLGRQAVLVKFLLTRRHVVPRHDAEHRQVQAAEQHDDQRGAEENGPRDRLARVAHLVTDIADVVISQIGIHRQDHRLAETSGEVRRRRGGRAG